MKSGSVILLVLAAALLESCSAGPLPGGQGTIGTVRQRTSFLQRQKIFVGHSDAARRVSWFDTADLSETRYFPAGGEAIGIVPAPNLDAVAVVHQDKIIVYDGVNGSLAGGGSREFSIPLRESTSIWAAATDAAAYAVVGQEIILKVVRHLGAAEWEEKTFNLPAAVSGSASNVFMSSDGTGIVVIEAKTGDYVVYSAPASTSGMSATPLECNQAEDLVTRVTKVFFHAGSGRLFVGGASGSLKSFLPFAPGGCKLEATWLDSSISGAGDVVSMSSTDPAGLAVSFGSGESAVLFDVSLSAVAKAANADGGNGALSCEGMGIFGGKGIFLDAAQMSPTSGTHAGAKLFATLCDASGGFGIACSLKVAGTDSNGGALEYEFPTQFSKEDIGAISVDPATGEVFLQYNDARGRVLKMTPSGDGGSYSIMERINHFLNGVLD